MTNSDGDPRTPGTCNNDGSRSDSVEDSTVIQLGVDLSGSEPRPHFNNHTVLDRDVTFTESPPVPVGTVLEWTQTCRWSGSDDSPSQEEARTQVYGKPTVSGREGRTGSGGTGVQ